MSAPGALLRECPVAQLGGDEADQPADANVRHLVALDTGVDPGARDLQKARGLSPVEPKLAVKLELRWMREDLGLTQADLAKLAGVSQPAIAQLESPDSNPTIDTLNRVARAMGAEIDFRPSAGESVKSYARQLRRLGPGPERARVL